MAALVAATGLLWLFHLYARVLSDGMVVTVWLFLAVVITFVRFWCARIRRERLFSACLSPATPLRRWFRGGFLLLLWHGVISLALAAALVLGIARFGSDAAAVALLAGLGFWLLLERGSRRCLRQHVHERWLPLISGRMASWAGVPLLVLMLLIMALGQAQPDLEGVTLERAVWHFVEAESARSGLLELGLEVTAATEGLRQWLVQQFLPGGYGNPLLLTFGWTLILLGHALFALALVSVFHAVQVFVDPVVRDYYRVTASEEMES